MLELRDVRFFAHTRTSRWRLNEILRTLRPRGRKSAQNDVKGCKYAVRSARRAVLLFCHYVH